MKLLEIQGSTAQERRDWLKSVLSKAQCEITFTKVDGTVRVMPCTLRSDLLPEAPILENSRRVRNQDSAPAGALRRHPAACSAHAREIRPNHEPPRPLAQRPGTVSIAEISLARQRPRARKRHPEGVAFERQDNY